ncbi:MAG: RidA family protein [Nanoarchaeota archaeon]|nr:RidA family protein [Nanoarchaeota archaeon]
MKTVNTSKAPEAIGPYSQAVIAGDLVFTSGQIAINPKTKKILEGNIEEQTKQVLENLKNVLEAAGSSLDNAIKVTVFLADMNDFGKMNEVYAKYFKKKPARSTVQVARLPKDVKIEMDVVALKRSSGHPRFN